jgi:hypothetical protein
MELGIINISVMGKQCLGCEIPVAKSFQTQIKGERTRKP